MRSKMLVVIDDESDLLDLLEYNLLRQGFEVVTFERATHAYEFIKEQRPDLIVCDWMMPEMDGVEFCQKLRSDLTLSSIPLVMITCHNGDKAKNKALNAGASAFLPKPFQISSLVGKVSQLLAAG
ncbi:response regulator [Pontibacter sp. G13]|uniref:response regulator n=1 Tax=Pontibacter sp. G13 TaxID=3074898 RepID=UPI00288BCAE9|nr:response regulator [Pontibacter sp. G13]WNJ17301.1 response regulator [Pontibacter sp. G13]